MITATRLNLSGDRIHRTMGTAKSRYLEIMEPTATRYVFPRDFPTLWGSTSPIRAKFIELNRVPRINPFPTVLCPAMIKKKPTIIAVTKDNEQYFFWVSLISFTGLHRFFYPGFSSHQISLESAGTTLLLRR